MKHYLQAWILGLAVARLFPHFKELAFLESSAGADDSLMRLKMHKLTLSPATLPYMMAGADERGNHEKEDNFMD